MKTIVLMILSILVLPLFSLIGEGVSPSSAIDTVLPEVTLTYPNGGEELYIGDTADITWTVTDFGLAANPITISYSDNNGQDYSELSNSEDNDGTYNWEIPSVVCDNNLIKIFAVDNFGNEGEDSSNSTFSIVYVPPAAPTDINVDLTNEIDAVITWAEVDTTIIGTPITVDGYVILYNEFAYEDTMHCYYYLANTDNETTTYTHFGVSRFRDQMYYKIVAYKDYRGVIRRILTTLPDEKLTWAELQRRFK